MSPQLGDLSCSGVGGCATVVGLLASWGSSGGAVALSEGAGPGPILAGVHGVAQRLGNDNAPAVRCAADAAVVDLEAVFELDPAELCELVHPSPSCALPTAVGVVLVTEDRSCDPPQRQPNRHTPT